MTPFHQRPLAVTPTCARHLPSGTPCNLTPSPVDEVTAALLCSLHDDLPAFCAVTVETGWCL